MTNAPQEQCAAPVHRHGDPPTLQPVDRHLFLASLLRRAPRAAPRTPPRKPQPSARCGPFRTALAVSLALLGGGVAAAQGTSPAQLRQFIDQQVGGIEKLMVPEYDADLPQPRLADGSPEPRFQTTEAKRYLGKQLFHDPVRAARILPEFGGVLATRQTASCGSCHLGEAASKAGTLLNFAAGGEGRHYTDAKGNFIPRRRPRTDILPILRQSPLFPGDALVDEIPTLTDIYEFAVGSPARGRKLPDPGRLLRTGRLDALDSVLLAKRRRRRYATACGVQSEA